jgi:N-hydroxyarylamine O-acetyltransferase
VDVSAYLARIGLAGPFEPDLANLERLQRAHLTAVPFENLDVYHRRGVRTGLDHSVPKVVERWRGGWCYELNGAFGALLAELGYEVIRHGAFVLFDFESPEPDHLALEVRLGRPYLVDVGFGDSFIRPLPLDDPGPHDGGTGDYAFEFGGGETTLLEVGPDGERRPLYRFGPEPFDLADFECASHHLETDPFLRWTQVPFATRLVEGGPDRVTLLADRLKLRRAGEWTERPVTAERWAGELMAWFGMTP